ncbi:hypothetical protein ACCS33_29525 [Rhizobium ruizarguesonis]|uniref:hypothetical protein n=1 Tax=Rhizobium ruizarguesonis TaxID=2081791 RepID=UPI0037222E97
MKRKIKVSIQRDGLNRRLLTVGEHVDGGLIFMLPPEKSQPDGVTKNYEHHISLHLSPYALGRTITHTSVSDLGKKTARAFVKDSEHGLLWPLATKLYPLLADRYAFRLKKKEEHVSLGSYSASDMTTVIVTIVASEPGGLPSTKRGFKLTELEFSMFSVGLYLSFSSLRESSIGVTSLLGTTSQRLNDVPFGPSPKVVDGTFSMEHSELEAHLLESAQQATRHACELIGDEAAAKGRPDVKNTLLETPVWFHHSIDDLRLGRLVRGY